MDKDSIRVKAFNNMSSKLRKGSVMSNSNTPKPKSALKPKEEK